MTDIYPAPPTNDFPATTTMPPPAAPASAADEPSTTEVAKDQAASVGQGAAEAGQHVAAVAKDQAAAVTAEAGQQVKALLGQTRQQLSEQTGAQQQKLLKGLQDLRDELASMAHSADQPGVGSDLVQQAANRTGAIAGWLDGRDPAALLAEVTAFARRRPGAFLAVAGGIGLLAGRLTRGLKAQTDGPGQTTETPSATAPTSHPGTPYPVTPAPVSSSSVGPAPVAPAPFDAPQVVPAVSVVPPVAPIADVR
jgi:hypothetical protein